MRFIKEQNSFEFCLVPKSTFKYVSWVPTITGRLSFSRIGDTKHPRKAVFSNKFDGRDRIIVGLQRRSIHDKLFTRFFKTNKDIWFLNISSTKSLDGQPLEALCGEIYLFHDRSHWLYFGHEIASRLISRLNRYSNEHGDIATYMKDEIQDAKQKLKYYSSFCCSYIMKRNGIVNFQYTEYPYPPYYRRPRFLIPDIFHSASSGTHWETASWSQDQVSRSVYQVISQSFYFLRDIVHEHQHHDPKTDTILDIYPFECRDWHLQVLYKLYGQVIQYKRFKTLKTLTRARGVLTYANAFYTILTSEQKKITVRFFHTETANSIETAIRFLEHESSNKTFYYTKRLGIFTTITTILMLSSTIIPNNVPEPTFNQLTSYLMSYCVHHPDRIISTLIVANLSTFVYENRSFYTSRLTNSLKRLNISSFRIFFGITYLLLSSLFILAIYFFLHALT